MGNVNQSFTERVRYTLFHKDYGSKTIQDPEGWESDDKEIARNEEYHGIFASFSNSLKFVGDGRDFIKFIYDVYGVNADIRLIKEEMHPNTDLWVKSYDGYLDLSTYEYQDNKVGIKFNAGGLEQLLKSRESDMVEIDRETTMDGQIIPPLVPNEVQLDGRKIFLKTSYEVKPPDNYADMFISSNNGGTRSITVGVPWKLVSKSHEESQDVSINTNSVITAGQQPFLGEPGAMFFLYSEVARTVRLKFNLSFIVGNVHADHIDYCFFLCCLTKYTGANYTVVNRTPLFGTDTGQTMNFLQGVQNSVSCDQDIYIGAGESLALEFLEGADFTLSEDAELRINVAAMSGTMTIEEDSHFDPSKSKMILIHDVCERLCRIISNQPKSFYSEYFGRTDLGYAKNGIGAYLAVTHGFWIRGFDKLPLSLTSEPNLFKPLTTSWKDTMSSLNAVCNVGLGIERRGYAERIVVEDMKYFYNRKVTIKLPFQVKKVKRTVAGKYFYNSLQVGYEKGGDYEEAMGLDEYNAKSNFTTVITRFTQAFIKISKWRADSYGKEFARRKPMFRYSTADTSYDNDIFLMDLKKDSSGVFKERKWQDDFAQAPTGTYDPASATGLRLSPFNMLLRQSWVVAAGFTKYPTDYIRYGSSTANSNLKTRLRNDAAYNLDTSATPGNGVEYAENGNIINNELKRARFIPEFVEFEHPITFDIMLQIEGTTMFNGKEIYNKYGLVQFINENNEMERGFLMNMKPNDGKFKVLKSNN